MPKLKNLKVKEITVCANPANEAAVSRIVKSLPDEDKKEDEAEKAEDEPESPSEEEKAECEECEGKEDCECPDEDKEASEPASDEDKDEADKADDEEDKEDLEKALSDVSKAQTEEQTELQKAMSELAEMKKAIDTMKIEKALSEKVSLVKSLSCPEALVSDIAKALVEHPSLEKSITALLQANQALKKASKLYEEVGKSQDHRSEIEIGKEINKKAAAMVKADPSISMLNAVSIVRKSFKENQ